MGWLPYALNEQGRWRCLTGELGGASQMNHPGGKTGRLSANKAYTLTACQTRKVPMRSVAASAHGAGLGGGSGLGLGRSGSAPQLDVHLVGLVPLPNAAGRRNGLS
jgi:hypothetical protein